MGGDFSKDAHPLAVAAVGEITHLDREQLSAFRDAIRWNRDTSHDAVHAHEDAAGITEPGDGHESEEHKQKPHQRRRRHEPDLSHRAFKEAMEEADLYVSDRAILDRMFTLMDKTGDDVIHAQSFSIGVALLLPGDLATKLHAAFDALAITTPSTPAESRLVTPDQLVEVLTTAVLVATYFGDPTLSTTTIRAIADSVFASPVEGCSPKEEHSIAQSELVKSLVGHPLVVHYVDNAPQPA